MYVLCAPCVLHPELRAKGITRPSDLNLFARSIERCNHFGIEMIPLPCPATLYLGPGRAPGTFLDRLNTPEFPHLLDRLEEEVRRIIRERGPPVCILGVNSSPTCGVTSTWYGSTGDEPPKREGRGVFLSRFPEISATDVSVFSRYRVYLAAPLFSEAERRFNVWLAGVLRDHFFEVFLPQETGDDSGARSRTEQERIFSVNRASIERADFVVAVVDGSDADSGTAWEMGYAFARNIPVIAYRTDFRRVGDHESVNLMLERSATLIRTPGELIDTLRAPVKPSGTQ